MPLAHVGNSDRKDATSRGYVSSGTTSSSRPLCSRTWSRTADSSAGSSSTTVAVPVSPTDQMIRPLWLTPDPSITYGASVEASSMSRSERGSSRTLMLGSPPSMRRNRPCRACRREVSSSTAHCTSGGQGSSERRSSQMSLRRSRCARRLPLHSAATVRGAAPSRVVKVCAAGRLGPIVAVWQTRTRSHRCQRQACRSAATKGMGVAPRRHSLWHSGLADDGSGQSKRPPAVSVSAGQRAVRLVGGTGFEPATSPSRTKRATKVRHTPRDCLHGLMPWCGSLPRIADELPRTKTRSATGR